MRAQMNEWFADEKFWTDFYDYMFPTESFEKAIDECDQIIKLIAPQGTDVLDLCCGPARHSVALAKKGYNLTSVDKTKYLLDKAKEYSEKENVSIDLIEQDMRSYCNPGSFNLILNLFHSFGYFAEPEDDLKVVQNMYESLKDSGRVILELMGKEILARIFEETSSTILYNGAKVVQRRKVINSWDEMENEWLLLKDNEYRSYKIKHRVYSAMELKDLFECCKFKHIRIYGNLDGADYDNNAERLILVAEK
jgi:SAM-dependent methyltransferase